jgi:hypothetical protein
MKNNLVNLSIEQLRAKLVDCESGSFKEFILNKIINKKISKEKQLNIELNKKKRIDRRNRKRNEEEINLVNSILKDQESISNNDKDEISLDFEEEPPKKNLNELEGHEFKFKKEVAKDHLNNNLAARLNSDIDIKKIQKKRKESKKDFVKPFEDATSNYDKFFDNVIPNNDFSNNRLM